MGFTITTDDEQVASLFEPGATPVEERLRALEIIHSSGVNTLAFVLKGMKLTEAKLRRA